MFGKELTDLEKKSKLIEILDDVVRYCNDNNLKYCLVAGTLLGAIRHNGFIPWDDDIDIALPRNDYDFLVKNFISHNGNTKIYTHLNKKNYIWTSAKAVSLDTVLIENGRYKNRIGLNIDIFPLDNISGSRDEVEKKYKRVIFYRDLFTLKYLSYNKKWSFWKKFVFIFGRSLFIVPDRLFFSIIEKKRRADNSNKTAEYICNFSGAWGVKEIMEWNWYVGMEEHLFEGKMYSIPKMFDKILSTTYGDYMTPPPIEKRITHHGAKVYWENNN